MLTTTILSRECQCQIALPQIYRVLSKGRLPATLASKAIKAEGHASLRQSFMPESAVVFDIMSQNPRKKYKLVVFQLPMPFALLMKLSCPPHGRMGHQNVPFGRSKPSLGVCAQQQSSQVFLFGFICCFIRLVSERKLVWLQIWIYKRFSLQNNADVQGLWIFQGW